jgi:hypothetical protein
MPFTVEEFRDLVRILEEKPEWRTELRRWVFPDELLSLPEQVASLRADTDRHFQELIEAQKRTNERITALVEAQQRTEAQVTALTEAQQHTDKQIALLTEAQQRLEAAQQHTDRQIALLTEAQQHTNKQVAELVDTVRTLVGDVGFLKGEALENRYRTKGYAYFSRMVRRAHVLSSDELIALFEDGRESGILSETEVDQLLSVDLVVRGKRDGTEVYLVVEVSYGVGRSDVERAAQRASLLAKVGILTIPVVAGEWVTAEAEQLARATQVWQVSDGRVVAPQ